MAKSAFLANMSHEIRTPAQRHLRHGPPDPARIAARSSWNTSTRSTPPASICSTSSAPYPELSKIEAGTSWKKRGHLTWAASSTASMLATSGRRPRGATWSKPGVAGLLLRRRDPPAAGPCQLRAMQVKIHRARARSSSAGPERVDGGGPGRFEVEDTGIGIDRKRPGPGSPPSSRPTTRPTWRYGGTGLGLAITRSWRN